MKTSVTLKVDSICLNKIKKNASDVGLPYQTYINALLHQDASTPGFTKYLKEVRAEVSSFKKRMCTAFPKEMEESSAEIAKAIE